jgi:membrane protease YdiL (CAAX protease family)
MMNNLPKTNILRLTIEIAVFVAVVVADAHGFVPITQTLFLVPLIWIMLRLSGERWSEIGFARPENFGWAIAFGVLVGVLMELFAVYVTTPLISGFFGTEPNYSQFKEIRGNLILLFIFLGLSWTLAAFGEEICFRGFLMKRVAQVFGESRAAWLLSSVLFGWGHTEQGVPGWIQEGLSGLILGVLFLCAKRNLVVPIVAHGVSNTLAFILIYFGRYPGLG